MYIDLLGCARCVTHYQEDGNNVHREVYKYMQYL